jgi:hypothetical protein
MQKISPSKSGAYLITFAIALTNKSASLSSDVSPGTSSRSSEITAPSESALSIASANTENSSIFLKNESGVCSNARPPISNS